MYLTEITVYWIGAFIFLISTIGFLINKQKIFDRFLGASDVFVSFLTTISYVVMALAIATVSSPYGGTIYWTRWLFYIASCSILTLNIAAVFGKKDIVDLFEISILTSLVMFCGFLASYITSLEKWLFFGLSSGAYVGLLFVLFRNSDYQTNALRRLIFFWVAIFWSIFPLVWILAPTGFGLISTFVESLSYLILDIITKIIFGVLIADNQARASV
ncbi:bacteriorhodopsin [[Eubacterium] cellulosolvens]